MTISIILVEPENPDNIGAVARAMKNMGLHDLRLVRPPEDWQPRAKKMAMSAWDVVKKTLSYSHLEEAIRDTSLVIATTRRQGAKRGFFISFQEAVQKISEISKKKKVAIVFGKESKGLDNQSLRACDLVTTIPASSEYPSINLAQSVMIVAFCLFQKNKILRQRPLSKELSFVSQDVIQDILGRWRRALLVLSYDREGGKEVIERILVTFHGIFKRNGLRESESRMLKGIARRIDERLGPTQVRSDSYG